MVSDRIHIDPQVCGRKATIRGLRLRVDFVLKLLGNGYTAAEIVNGRLKGSGLFYIALFGHLPDNLSLLDGSVIPSPSHHRR